MTRDHKGYKLTDRPFDWQDKLVLVACFWTAIALGLVLWLV